jgi:Na+/H+-translocating membrane pyrophosphatase
MQFIKQDYVCCLALLVLAALPVWLLTEKGLTTAVALLLGGLVNMISSLIALVVATQSNFRVAYCARFGTGAAFRTAYKASCAIGFGVTSVSLLGNSHYTQP